MIYKRAVAKLRAQDWMAIAIEVAIVIIGVFIGNQVSNWNAARIDDAETARILRNLRPEGTNLLELFGAMQGYYQVTRRYADTALAGWQDDPAVSDHDFVIAAYQASQNFYSGSSSATWAQIVGSDRLRTIADPGIRADLSYLMTTDYAVLERDLFTDYRRHVREVIPEDVQDAIRQRCGDQRYGATGTSLRLPRTCVIELPAARFRIAAQALRNRRDLIGELRWQIAAAASYVDNVETLKLVTIRLLARIDRL